MRSKTNTHYPLYFAAIIFLLFSCNKKNLTIQLELKSSAPQITYAADKLKELQQTNAVIFSDSIADLNIQAEIDSLNLKSEAYRIISQNNVINITGGDAVGLMYGMLEVKDQLKAGKRIVESKEESPKLMFRAIKFNLPWDSYRRSPALDLHYETCRDTIFWHSFLDMMVENRFNKLTLWNLHPFSYMVKTAKYPEGCSLSDLELAEWQKFWSSLFRMAKNRGIETYLVNWNIFVSPEFARAHNVCDYCLEGKHFVPQGDTSAVTKDFYRESIKAVIDTYPDLTGLGLTLGEGMGNMTAEERQKWILDNYIQGMRMASRKAKFIYRVPLSAGTSSGGTTSIEVEKLTRSTLDTLTCFDGPINIELKFNWSHAYSTPHLVKVHGGKLNDAYWNPMPENYYLAWMMRNEDFFMLRWGQTDFIRKHIATNVHPHVNGYYVGSETYIPAKDYITSLPGTSYKYAFERQWMYYKAMGRLLYNPDTPDEFFKNEFEQRFPKTGNKLFEAQTLASKVPLVIASWQNATWDFSLYSEGMLRSVVKDNKKSLKLISLDDMAEKMPMEPAYLSIADFLANENNVGVGKISPFHLADSLESVCIKALKDVKGIRAGENVDLLYEVSDIKAWANLGLYFSNKLRAAVEYKRYKTSNDDKDLKKAIEWLTKATTCWHSLVEVTTPVYKPVPLTHFCENDKEFEELYFHWSIVEKEVSDELNWLKSLEKNIVPVVPLAQTPPMGWNSFDSYGVYLHEKAAMANIEAFAEKLKPYGYEYFVIDAGWFGEFKLQEGTIFPAEKHAQKLNFNEFGLLQPSETYFPNGLQPIIDRCHELGLKFGLHLMRGIPRAAVKANTPVKGTKYFAEDIADTTSICVWNHQNYGVDMSKPGAREFYNSLINQMARWGVDFIKYDDIVPFPEEVKAVANAIAQCGRPIVLSLSPGGKVDPGQLEAFKMGQMLRVTPDIWDDQKGIDECFEAWRKWQGKEQAGFWIDMDMIPFGQLQLMSPIPSGVKGNETKSELMQKMKSGELATFELLAGKGFNRWCEFSKDQMYTFITLRALSASPLMMGGDLPTLDEFSLELLTNKAVLECNQNGVMGSLVYEADGLEVWKAPGKSSKGGWIGIFNRTMELKLVSLKTENLGLDAASSYMLFDIWNNTDVTGLKFDINPSGVVFLKY